MMRIVSTDGLEPMTKGGQGPWRIEGNRLLKTTVKHKPIQTLDEAQAVFDTYCAAHEAAPWTPKPFDVAQTPNGYGVVVEYVHGDKVLPYIVLGILTPEEVGQGLSELLHELHATTTNAGKDWNEAFRVWARTFEPMLARDAGRQLVRLIDAIHDLFRGRRTR